MRRPMYHRVFAAIGLLLCVAVSAGCKELEQVIAERVTPVSEPAGDRPLTTIEGFDHEDLLSRLQGDWVVERNGARTFEFHIDGERASAVDHRFSTPRPMSGELVLRSSTGFGIDVGEMVYFFSFVQANGATFMGRGGAIHAPAGEPFTAHLGAWERLVRTEEGCTYINTFGGTPKEKESKCEVGKRGEREVFTFTAPDPFRPDHLKTFELTVAGDYLLERDLAEAVARPMAAPTAAPPGAAPATPGEPAAEEPDVSDDPAETL